MGPASRPRLIFLDCWASLRAVTDRELQSRFVDRDLGGFFDRVWHVHPVAGASPTDPGDRRYGLSRASGLAAGHTVIEAPAGALAGMRRLGAANFLLAQGLLLLRLSWLVRRQAVGLVAAADPLFTGLWGLTLSRLHRIPLVVVVNANYDAIYRASGSLGYPRLLRWRRLEVALARAVLARADLVTVGSADNLDYVLANGADPGRVAVVPTGDLVAGVHRRPPDGRPPVAGELGLTQPYFLMVARLEPSKHPEDVLRALAALRRAGRDVAAVLVGDGSMRPGLERLAGELGLEGRVVLAGDRPQDWIARAMAHAAVNVCPLSGLALVEAALSGAPVVAYDVEWHRELVDDGRTGVLVDYRDVEGLAGAIAGLLDDPTVAGEMGRAARAAALRAMDREMAFAVKRDAYRRLLETPASDRRRRRRPRRQRRPARPGPPPSPRARV